MANKDQILTSLVNLCDEHHLFDQPAKDVVGKDLIEDCMIDSMTLMQLQALVEEKFKLAIPNATVIKELRTLNDLATFIAAHT